MTNMVACKGKANDVFERGTADSVVPSQLEAELTRALNNHEFRVYFQPIVSLETSEIRGFEALVRWRHPSRGLLSPSDFLPVMENTGLIVPLGLWVLREASSRMHQWRRRFPSIPLLYLSVNISSKLFQEPDLVEQISQILNETGLNPASLTLEITETVVMQNAEAARSILLRLRALNIRLAIDDFGTGYSSLSYLQKFPVHTLKIDRSFVSRLQEDKESVEIVRAIVNLAHNLGLDVIAEGIEAGHQRALLRLLRCESGQGHFYSKAVDDQRAGKLLNKQTFLVVTADNLGGEQVNSQLASEGSRRTSTEAEVDTKVEEGHSMLRETKNRRLAFLGAIAATIFIMLALGIRTQGNGQKPVGGAESQAVVTGRAALDEARPGPVQGSGVARTAEVQKEDTSSVQAELKNSRSDGKHDSSNEPRSHEKNVSKAHPSSVEPERLLGSQTTTAVTRNPRQQLTTDSQSYLVIHDHLLGGCSGYLRITPESIVFEPTQVKGHAFVLKLTDIVGTERGETLKIKFEHETYRFKAKFAKDKADNLSRLASLDQALTKFRAEAGLYRR